MNWGSLASAIVGALIGGVFLLVGQRYSVAIGYRRARKAIFVEMRDNVALTDTIIERINGASGSVTLLIPFCVQFDVYDRHEEALLMGTLGTFSEIRSAVSYVKQQQDMVALWSAGVNDKGNCDVSRNVLIECQGRLIRATEVLSLALTRRDLKDIHWCELIQGYKKRLESFSERSSCRPLMLTLLPGEARRGPIIELTKYD